MGKVGDAGDGSHAPAVSRWQPRGQGEYGKGMRALALAPVLLTFGACASPPVAETPRHADFSGIDPFWRVAEILQADREPTEADWDALFVTPGYAIMKRNDRSDVTLKKLLPLALRPSLAAEADEFIANSGLLGLFVVHLRSAAERRDELDRYRRTIEHRDLVSEALDRTIAWLPADGRDDGPLPLVAFVLLEPDARGYDPIVVDLLYALEAGDRIVDTIAHELHHVFRGRASVLERPDGDFPERELLRGLDNLQSEGIADQIDKRDYLATPLTGDSAMATIHATVQERYRAAYEASVTTLAQVDALLAAYAASPDDAPELGRELVDALVLGGHPVGFHMANAIRTALGRDRLIAHFADPFAFVRDYDTAARELGAGYHAFSPEALAGLERLRQAFRR